MKQDSLDLFKRNIFQFHVFQIMVTPPPPQQQQQQQKQKPEAIARLLHCQNCGLRTISMTQIDLSLVLQTVRRNGFIVSWINGHSIITGSTNRTWTRLRGHLNISLPSWPPFSVAERVLEQFSESLSSGSPYIRALTVSSLCSLLHNCQKVRMGEKGVTVCI